MNPRNVSSFLMVLVGGILFGWNIGYVAPLEAFYGRLSNCSAISEKGLCRWVSNEGVQGCEWKMFTRNVTVAGTNKSELQHSFGCTFSKGFGNCSHHAQQGSCADDEFCVWDAQNKACNHRQGFTAAQNGLIATMMILGAFAVSLIAGKLVDRLGLKAALGVASAINLAAGAMQFGAWADESFAGRFALLLIARLITGASIGISTVVCPMYVGDVATKDIAGVISVFFQIFITFGIVVAAGVGFALHPDTDGLVKNDANKFQVLNGINIALTVVQALASWWVVSPEAVRDADAAAAGTDPNGPRVSNSDINSKPSQHEKDALIDAGAKDASGKPAAPGGDEGHGKAIWMRPKWLFVAVLLGAILQTSGINAIMNFAPQIADDVGLTNPFLSNFLVMIVNFVTTIISVPLAKKLKPHTAFYSGGLLCGLFCLLTGIPTFPGVVDSDSARNGLLVTGILMFITLFECLVGPFFYFLAQSSFPDDIRSDGCALSLGSNFMFNALVNFIFPVAVEAFSGGPSGNQAKGLAIVFIIFAALSIVGTCTLYFIVGKGPDNNANDDDLSSLGARNDSSLDNNNNGGRGAGYGAAQNDSSVPKL